MWKFCGRRDEMDKTAVHSFSEHALSNDATYIGFSSTRSSMEGEGQCFRWLPFHMSFHVRVDDVRN